MASLVALAVAPGAGSAATGDRPASRLTVATGLSAIQLPHATWRQERALSCEAAALRMALSYYGVNVSEDSISALVPTDLRGAVPGGDGGVAAWGDPYQAFVGDINGSEVFHTGYGVYDGPIATAARKLGVPATAGEGWDPRSIYNAVLNGHPVVAWVINTLATVPTHHYRAFDGRVVPYAPSASTPWPWSASTSGRGP